MEALGQPPRGAQRHEPRQQPRAPRVPCAGACLIGFQGEFMTLTRGTGLISHIFDGFAPVKGDISDRHNGVLVSNEHGEAVAYALFNLQERGRLFVAPARSSYEGMIIGIHSRDNGPGGEPDQDQKPPTSAPPARTRRSC